MHDEYGSEIDASRDDYYAWSAAFISYVMRAGRSTLPLLAVALRLHQHRQGSEAQPHVWVGGGGRVGG